jgi:hypothetical protein
MDRVPGGAAGLCHRVCAEEDAASYGRYRVNGVVYCRSFNDDDGGVSRAIT